MHHFYIKDANEDLLSENLKSECHTCRVNCKTKGNQILECPIYGNKRRQGFIKNNKGSTFLCDTTKTTKLFKDKILGFSYAIQDLVIPKEQIVKEIRSTEQQKVNRLVHNLTSINAHNIQEIYNLIPQDILSSNWKTQLEFIEKELVRNSKNAALMFLRVAKHNIHMKSEFSIYRKLDRNDSVALDFKYYQYKTTLLNVLHTFFSDFSNNGVYIKVNDFFGKVKIDYETVQVALYHFIENATKYTKPNTTVEIDFIEDVNSITMHIIMNSYHICPEEREKIFEEGISGKTAIKLGKNGDGIGLWRIRQMIKLNGGEFNIDCGNEIEKFRGVDFSINKFSIKLNKN